MNRKLDIFVILSIILLLVGCKSTIEVSQTVTIITQTATSTQPVTARPTSTLFPTWTPTSTPNPPTATKDYSATQDSYEQTVEALITYHDPDYDFSISYPSNWKKVGEKEFRGDDGYLKIQGIDAYHTASRTFVCADYIYQNYFGENYYDDIAIVPYIIGCVANVGDLEVNIDYVFSERGFDYYIIEILTTESSPADFMMIANTYIQHEEAQTKKLIPPENTETYEITLPNGISIREEFVGYVESLSSFDSWGDDSLYSSWSGLKYEDYQYCVNMWTGDTREVIYNGDIYEVSLDSFWGGYTKIKKNQEIIYHEPKLKIMLGGTVQFCTWDNHWILERTGFLVQDGEILNHKYGYEDMFGWTLLANKPFYFYVAEGKTYISYDGHTLPVSYDIVPHYRCCDIGASTNPARNMNQVYFLGRKAGAWYKILVSVEK